MSNEGVPKTKLAIADQYVTIGQASKHLGVSIDTLRRWERDGKLKAQRLDGRNRYFLLSEVDHFKKLKPLSSHEVAKQLGVSASTVRRLEEQGNLVPSRDHNGKRLYQPATVGEYMAQRQETKQLAQA